MRVCLLTRFFTPSRREGVGIGRVSEEILKGLVKERVSVKTVSTAGDSVYSYFWYTLVQTRFRIPRDCDVYHALTPMESIWIPKGRSLVTFHDLLLVSNPERLGAGIGYSSWKHIIGTIYFELVCKVASRAKILVCVSEKTKADVVRYLKVPEEKVRVIRSGISKNLKPIRKTGNAFRIGYLGVLDKRKRVDLLIDSFKQSRIGGELVIAGRGLDESLLRRKAEEDVRIKFLGFVKGEDLCNFYNSLDVLVYPTWLEGYGLPIVEAMACKKPVVVLSDATIPLEVKSRCVIVENLDMVFENKDYLERLCKSVDIESNYMWAKEHDWDKCVDEYIKLYQEIS